MTYTNPDDADATPDGADAPTQETSGTQDVEVRDAATRTLSDAQKLNLEWKAKAEEANRLAAENAALREALKQSPAAPKPTASVNGDEDDELQAVREFAAKGDPVARAVLRARERQDQIVVGTRDAMMLSRMPDGERDDVRKLYVENPGRFGDPEVAREFLRSRKLQDENERLRLELKKATVRSDPDVVRTDVREVGASEAKIRTMTAAEWDEEQARLLSEGKILERMARQRQYREGKIKIP